MGAPVTATLNSSELYTNAQRRQAIQFAAINASSSGNNTVVAAVTGKRIKVINYTLIASGAVTATWESSGGAIIGGPYSLAANGGASPAFSPVGLFQTEVGEGLLLVLGGATQVGGHLAYLQV